MAPLAHGVAAVVRRKCLGLSDGGEDRNHQAWFSSMGQSSASMLVPQLPSLKWTWQLCKFETKAILKTDRNAQFKVECYGVVSIKTRWRRGSGYVGYLPVTTGWYMLLHNQERIPNNQENSCAMSCVLINCNLDF